jgi:hypothetical protein
MYKNMMILKYRSMMTNLLLVVVVVIVIMMLMIQDPPMMTVVEAGPGTYAICQSGCNYYAVACYAAAAFTFGTVTSGVGIPAAIASCM